MALPDRRTFLKGAGASIGIGGTLAAGGFVAADRSVTDPLSRLLASAQDETTPLREPGAETNWVGYRSGPGHDAAVAEAPAVDPDNPGCTCFYRGEFDAEPAVVDDAMYLPAGGRILALDAREGTVQWKTDDLGVAGTPSVGYGRLFATGDGRLLALDLDDRSVAWEESYDDGPSRIAVAYETVYTVADGALRALNVADGSARWARDDETFLGYPAVADGTVYAIVENPDSANDQDLAALDAAAGEELWRSHPQWMVEGHVVATEDRVSAAAGYQEREYFDAETGEFVESNAGEAGIAHDADGVVAYRTDYRLEVEVPDGDSWDVQGGNRAFGRPTIAGDTVFAYLGRTRQEDLAEHQHSLLAFDKSDGTVRWSCETQAVDDPFGSVEVVATGDAVYVVGADEIHAVHGADTS